MNRIFKTILLLSITFSNIKAQNFQYGLMEFSYSSFNPALAIQDDKLSIGLLHRSQNYLSYLSLLSTSFNFFNPIFSENKMLKRGGFGLSLIDSRSNINSFIIGQSVMGNILLSLSIQRNHKLTFSLQPGFSKLRASLASFSTGSQYNVITGYDPSQPNGEYNLEGRTGYFTLDGGLLWVIKDRQGNERAHFGFSVFSFNFPENSFSDSPSTLHPTYSLQALVNAYKGGQVGISPVISSNVHNQYAEYSVGAEWNYTFHNYNPLDPIKSGSLKLITLLNNNGTFKWGLVFDQPEYSLGVSYSTSSLTNRNTVIIPSIEFGIKVKINKKKKENFTIETTSVSEVRSFFEESRKEKQADADPEGNENSMVSMDKMKTLKFELIKDFQFGFNDTDLSDTAKKYLDEVIVFLRENPLVHLKAIGHTDDVGSRQNNQVVSRKRAEAAVNYIISQGIDQKRLKATGKGDSEPVYPNDTEENRAGNRRVELILYFSGEAN